MLSQESVDLQSPFVSSLEVGKQSIMTNYKRFLTNLHWKGFGNAPAFLNTVRFSLDK